MYIMCIYIPVSGEPELVMIERERFNEEVCRLIECWAYDMVRVHSLYSCAQQTYLIVDDEGLLKHREINRVATKLAAPAHSYHLVGPAVLIVEDFVDGEPDVGSLSQVELEIWLHCINRLLEKERLIEYQMEVEQDE